MRILLILLILSGCSKPKERYNYDFKQQECIKQTLELSNEEIKSFYNKNTNCNIVKPFGTVVIIQCNNGDYIKNYQSYIYTESKVDCQEFEISAAAIKSEGL